MGIKYDAVFGDQLLFGDDRSNATVVVSFDDGAKVFIDPDKYRVATPLFGYNGSFSIAMRRIISKPTWTVADQKAGKLPEVGCAIMVSPNCSAIVTAVDNVQKVVAVQCENQALDILSIHEMSPIESPKEKAARLRSEWCNRAMDYSTIQQLYDALLSGDLAAPKGGE